MKKLLIFMTVISASLMSFKEFKIPADNSAAAEVFSQHIIEALQQQSAQKYATLFPSLQEFQSIMARNEIAYGPFLKEAQNEFAKSFEEQVKPDVYDSFEAVLKEGANRKIDWSKIKLVRIETERTFESRMATIPVTLILSQGTQEFSLHFKKVIIINGAWKPTQHISLI